MGPHSDRHRLYCAWTPDRRTLLTRLEFESDLDGNLRELERFGVTRMLLVWEMHRTRQAQTPSPLFGDRFDALGQPGTNGLPDLLDEARWGLDWMLKLHPAPDQLYHQVADDRDHWGWRLPQDERADYGWGRGSNRVVYGADGEKNPFGIGVPFIWCSNHLLVALVTQCSLYEQMSGDDHYREFAARHRDWLVGRNPWGTTQFMGVGVVSPGHVHLMTTRLTQRALRGGLVDGPVYERIFMSLKGVSITQPDPLAEFQDPRAVYHDDLQDYASNEPTLDGTASAILMWAVLQGI